MRVAMLLEGYNAVGGVAQLVESLSGELLRIGHRVAVVSTFDRRARENGYERTPHGDVECAYIEIPHSRPFSMGHLDRFFQRGYYRRRREFVGFLSKWRPDVVNSHLCRWDRYPTATGVCRSAGVPLVQSFHVADLAERGRLGDKAVAALSAAAAFTACSAFVRDFFVSMLPQARAAHVISAGVDVDAARSAQPYDRKRPYILCVSRLYLAHKAIDVLISAFAALAPHHPELDLLIAGDGPDRARVEAIVAESALGGRIEMLGTVAQAGLWGLYKGAMLFAMPSRFAEPLGQVFLEAMACGTPIVATRTGGVPEIVREGETGLLVGRNEPGELAAAVGKLLDDAQLRKRMSERGPALAAQYAWPRVAARFIEVYQSCAAAA